MILDLKEIATASMVLFAVIDIIGSIPLILDLNKKVGHIESGKATIVSAFLMILFLFVGESILGLIGIGVSDFAIAGSFILFFLALELILGISLFKDNVPKTASIVPLAFPLIAGAGTMTTLISLRAEYAVENIVLAILVNTLFVYAVLKSTKRLEKMLGTIGMAVIRKVFGIILLAIAIKLFRANIGVW